MIKYFRFADVLIEIRMPDNLQIPDNLHKFSYNFQEDESEITFRYDVEIMKELVSHPVSYDNKLERQNMTVYYKGTLETRWLYFGGSDVPYGIYEEVSDAAAKVFIAEEQKAMMVYDTIFVSLLSLEKLMMKSGALILHSAYMCRDGYAILFSAPSGTGKSTQADLWEKYRGTRTINGDCSLLYKQDGIWYAFGWPICGSSEICFNESYPIQSIVMLYQSKENVCRPLSILDALKKIYSQIKVNMWNSEFQNQVFDLLEDLLSNVKVLELGCDISENAVKCLEENI